MKPAELMDYFEYSEFDSPDEPGSGEKMSDEFLRMLIMARKFAGVPFVINSGWRTEQHNIDVGGKPNSSHKRGVAADIDATTSGVRFKVINGALKAGFRRIGVGNDFIHIDSDPLKDQDVMWQY